MLDTHSHLCIRRAFQFCLPSGREFGNGHMFNYDCCHLSLLVNRILKAESGSRTTTGKMELSLNWTCWGTRWRHGMVSAQAASLGYTLRQLLIAQPATEDVSLQSKPEFPRFQADNVDS